MLTLTSLNSVISKCQRKNWRQIHFRLKSGCNVVNVVSKTYALPDSAATRPHGQSGLSSGLRQDTEWTINKVYNSTWKLYSLLERNRSNKN